MISSRQIKAARALLGWTQTDLAKATGLHLNAVNKIENEAGEPRSSSLERIQLACENGGLRFRGQRGVELRDDIFESKRFEGPDYMRHLADDVILVAKNRDEILYCVANDQLFDLADRKQNDRYYKHMKKIGFRERYIMSKRPSAFINPDRKIYRLLPEKVLGTVAYAVYGDRNAFINWQTREILIIRNKSLSATFRGQFEFLWSQARPFE